MRELKGKAVLFAFLSSLYLQLFLHFDFFTFTSETVFFFFYLSLSFSVVSFVLLFSAASSGFQPE